ncbi:MAG TPA: bifunctional molybdenum cofactor biosynthesis protein MoaC/MoaB [Chlorobaculum sp.]|jgi:molybdenum cofactor biosynthesis protein MoaC|nr:bifunctional molybdenum cofactor biosynthesis protein MoaC/MoaB [Chlorobaculum sp.]
MIEFTHLDDSGTVRMVDVSGKPPTRREAQASGWITMQPQTIALLTKDALPKGNVLAAAKIAGIQAAKQAANLIPLCHQLNLSWIELDFETYENRIGIRATVRTRESTGVEMEALTAVSVAALTIYDMCKAVDKTMEITGIRLELKKGGKQMMKTEYRPKASVLVMSDSISRGTGRDISGSFLREGLEAAGCTVEHLSVVADEPEEIASMIDAWVRDGIELIVTSGGTGLGPRDLTIETLLPKFTRRLPGVEQALFQWGQGKIRTAMLSRLAAGVIGDTVVICLPGSPGAAGDALEVLVPGVFHAFSMLHGEGH